MDLKGKVKNKIVNNELFTFSHFLDIKHVVLMFPGPNRQSKSNTILYVLYKFYFKSMKNNRWCGYRTAVRFSVRFWTFFIFDS